jgi:hypothetical protein
MALQRAKDGVPVDAKARKAALVGGGQTATNVQYAKIDSDFPQSAEGPGGRRNGRLPAAGITLLRSDVEGDARSF